MTCPASQPAISPTTIHARKFMTLLLGSGCFLPSSDLQLTGIYTLLRRFATHCGGSLGIVGSLRHSNSYRLVRAILGISEQSQVFLRRKWLRNSTGLRRLTFEQWLQRPPA